MRHAGTVNQGAIEAGFECAVPGTPLSKIDEVMEAYIRDHEGCRPAFKNYQPEGAASPFPFTACISPNEVVVHGIPGDYRLLPGDLLTIDVGTEYQGFFVDSARTRIVPGEAPTEKIIAGNRMIHAVEDILGAQLGVIRDGCNFLTMVQAAEAEAKRHDVLIMPQWGGHGIGNKIHFEPYIPSAIDRTKPKLTQNVEERLYARSFLTAGQTICVEPVITLGNSDIILDSDQWTYRKTDGHLVAHSERCILVTETGYELLS